MTRTRRLSWLALALVFCAAPAAMADDYLVYTDAGIPGGGSDVWVWCPSPPCDFAEIGACANPEGIRSFRQRGIDAWMGFGVFHNINYSVFPAVPGEVDLSAFAGGELRFFVKSTFNLKIEMQCRVNGQTQGRTRYLAQTNWVSSPDWQEVVIPLADFFAPQPVNTACLAAVLSPFMATAEGLPFALNTFQVDNVRWRKANAHAGPSSVQVQGRQLVVNGEPFVVNGMAYAPISIGEDWKGALRNRPDRYLVDFPQIAASGANTVRLYSAFLTTAMLDAAWAEGLHVIPTFQVDPLQLGCEGGRNYMRDRFVESVNQWKNHPAILAWLVGNEINAHLGSADACLDWYPQLDAMALAAHQAEGSSFHPVGPANADNNLNDICVAGCSNDTALPNVDFWGVQVYRGCRLSGMFSQYAAKVDCAKPLMVTEFGADAWDSLSGPAGAENQTMQADCLELLLDDANQALAGNPDGVSAGQIVFEWADEWWKAFPPNPPVAGLCTATDWAVHDTCKNWENFGYPDPAMNEEWWGIASLDAADPNARGLRAAHDVVRAAWQRGLGAVCNLRVDGFDDGSGNASISFAPAAGATDHTLYYGPLSSVSSYGYSGSVTGLGSTGSSGVTLPGGSLFWLVVGRDTASEGCYGLDSAAGERPCFPDGVSCSVTPAASRSCQCSNP